MDQELLERIADALLIEPSVLTIETKAEDLPEWDSMGTMNILIMLDDKYAVKLAPGETAALQSVAGIVELLRKMGKIK